VSKFEPGDRVRITFDATVKANGDYEIGGATTLGSWWADTQAKVEKIAPALPTTPGSVIQRGRPKEGYYLMLGDDGYWRSNGGNAIGPQTAGDGDLLRIIFDAGAK